MTEKEKDQQALEEKGFNAATDSLTPEAEPSPLDVLVEEAEETSEKELETGKEGEETKGAEGESPVEEEVEEEAEAFIGDLSTEEVLDKLNRIDNIEPDVLERVTQKVMGKFGEFGQQLKALQEKEVAFDATKLTKLKEVDEGIYDALVDGLGDALTVRKFDKDPIVDDMRKTVVAELVPYMERRILDGFVPDAETVVATKEFRDWYHTKAPQKVRDVFEAWDAETKMDGVAMAQGFKQFADYSTKQEGKRAAKKSSVARSVETKKTPKAPDARSPMSEEEAFLKRTSEMKS